MGRAKNWTSEEKQYLEDNWGTISMDTLQKHLGRSKNGILLMAQRLNLGPFLQAGEYITFNQLMKVLRGHDGYSYQEKSWIENRSFPVKYKRVGTNRFKVVYLDDFWEWASKYRDFIDWALVEENILGMEPAWVKEKRREHYQRNRKYKTTPWTKSEDAILLNLLKEQRYEVNEISQKIGRTAGAIQRRCCDLGTPYRPVKADNHNNWSKESLDKLADMIKNHRSYEYMAEVLGRSSKAIRGTVYRMYLTENVDKAAVIIGEGSWGDNRPARPIKHTTLNTQERKEVRRDMIRFLAILRNQIKEKYDDEDYWQKDICQHWNGYCTKDETNCDECTQFLRIRAQYCVRCGRTFYERAENKLCEDCRKARKKQAQKKYAIIKGKRVYTFEAK